MNVEVSEYNAGDKRPDQASSQEWADQQIRKQLEKQEQERKQKEAEQVDGVPATNDR